MFLLKISTAIGARRLAGLDGSSAQTGSTSTVKKASKKTTPESLAGRYTITSGEKEGCPSRKGGSRGPSSRSPRTRSSSPTRTRRRTYSASYKLDTTKTHPARSR